MCMGTFTCSLTFQIFQKAGCPFRIGFRWRRFLSTASSFIGQFVVANEKYNEALMSFGLGGTTGVRRLSLVIDMGQLSQFNVVRWHKCGGWVAACRRWCGPCRAARRFADWLLNGDEIMTGNIIYFELASSSFGEDAAVLRNAFKIFQTMVHCGPTSQQTLITYQGLKIRQKTTQEFQHQLNKETFVKSVNLA